MRGRPPRDTCPADVVPRLGVESDATLARELHVSALTVAHWRERRGLLRAPRPPAAPVEPKPARERVSPGARRKGGPAVHLSPDEAADLDRCRRSDETRADTVVRLVVSELDRLGVSE